LAVISMDSGAGSERVLSVREATFDLLRDFGLTTVFGNPGSTEETFLKNFPDDFRFVLALQEASVIAIADGFAQATRTPALVNIHTATGLGNAMGNLMTSFLNRTPLIVTAGQQDRRMLLLEPWLTNVEPGVLPRPWVKWAYQPARAQDVPAAFMRAYATATQPPAGPVFLSLPLDDWQAAALGPAVVRSTSTRTGPDPARIRLLADAIRGAKRPVLIFGAAVARGSGWDQAVALAEKMDAPVWAAPSSERAPFPEDHPLYLGGLPFAIGPLARHLDGHDLAVVVGAPVFRYYPYVSGDYLPDGLRLWHVTDDPAEAGRAPVGHSILGDPVLTIEQLLPLVTQATRAQPLRPTLPHRMSALPQTSTAAAHASGRRTARGVFDELRRICPADAVLVEETPSNLGDLHAAWPITQPDGFYTMASGGLGWSAPASVGIALAERDSGRNRLVVMVIGDGSFQYSLQSLWTAAQLRLPVLFVVLRNGEYAILKAFAEVEDSPGIPGLDIPGIDIVALARGYGCHAARAETAEVLQSEVADAAERHAPTVLEVPIAATIPPLL
jgi:benzoylformate decarboxylase